MKSLLCVLALLWRSNLGAWTPPVLVAVVTLVFIVAQMDLQQAYLVM